MTDEQKVELFDRLSEVFHEEMQRTLSVVHREEGPFDWATYFREGKIRSMDRLLALLDEYR